MTEPNAEYACHAGHRIYIGGIRDGDVDHLVYAMPSDYPQTLGTFLRNGVRSHYERDLDGGAHCIYRCVAVGAHIDCYRAPPNASS